jgi:hypothetical protein
MSVADLSGYRFLNRIPIPFLWRVSVFEQLKKGGYSYLEYHNFSPAPPGTEGETIVSHS